MPRYKYIIISIVSVLILIAILFWGGSAVFPDFGTSGIVSEEGTVSGSKIGKIAPDFSLPESLKKNSRLSLSEFGGRPVIIFFWATWEEESLDQMKIFSDFSSKSETAVIAINSQEERIRTDPFLLRGEYGIRSALDIEGKTSKNYGIKRMPTSFFIDSRGIIRAVKEGIISESEIVDNVKKLFN